MRIAPRTVKQKIKHIRLLEEFVIVFQLEQRQAGENGKVTIKRQTAANEVHRGCSFEPNQMETAMNKLILSVLAAASTVVAAGTALAPTPAEAGMGVRLGFGVPLGSFVARPHAPDSYHQRSYSRRKVKQHKSYSAARAERQARAAESARVRAARRAAKVRAQQLARAEARAEAAKAEARAELAKLNKAKAELEKQKEKTEQTASVETGSTTPAAAPEATAPVAETKPATAEVQQAAVATSDDSTDEPAPQRNEDPANDDGEQDCKKFIPAVGVTISVGC